MDNWFKNGWILRPFSCLENFFHFEMYTKNMSALDHYIAPGIAIHISNMKINNTYAVQCRFEDSFKMCPEMKKLGHDYSYSNRGGFLAQFGSRGSAEDVKIAAEQFGYRKGPTTVATTT